MKRNLLLRLTAVVLLMAVMSFILPLCVGAQDSQGEKIYIVAGSDFQQGTHAGSAKNVTDILSNIKKSGVPSLDGFLFCGDYDKNTIGNATETANGITALKKAVSDVYSGVGKTVLVKGNHDVATASGLSKSGANDADGYGVFVINESDYTWKNDDETKVKSISEKLSAYLSAKEEERYTKPIFVVSHLPLHYSMRTFRDGDAKYANYIFDILNNAGACGLNIVFLYGHDHSNGWDNYLGGGSVCLTKGDKIRIAQASQTVIDDEILNFTYLNAGYTGYYDAANGADAALSMTLFEISGDSMKISRYGATGIHALKSAGTYNSTYDDRMIVLPDKKSIPGALDVILSDKVVPNKNVEFDSGITVSRSADIITMYKTDDDKIAGRFSNGELYTKYEAYNIASSGNPVGAAAEIKIPLNGYDAETTRFYLYDGKNTERLNAVISEDSAVIRTNRLGIFIKAECKTDGNTYTRVSRISQLAAGDGYLMTYTNGTNTFFMTPKVKSLAVSSVTRTGFELVKTSSVGEVMSTKAAEYSWTMTETAGGWLVGKDGKYAKLTGTSDKAITATLETKGTVFAVSGASDFTFGGGGYVLNYNESRALINGYASDPAVFTIYKVAPRFIEDGIITEKTNSEFASYIWQAEADGNTFRFRNKNSGKALDCDGNATLGADGARFTVVLLENGFRIGLAEATGGKAVGESLHFGSGNRCSVGEHTPFVLYKVTADGKYIRAEKVVDGAKYLIVSENGDTRYALSDTVYSTGGASRIETAPLTFTVSGMEQPDGEAPIITGIENEKTYCLSVSFTVTDENINGVFANGTKLTPKDGTYTLTGGATYNIVTADKSGNCAVTNITVNSSHTVGDECKVGNRRGYVCSVCGEKFEADNRVNPICVAIFVSLSVIAVITAVIITFAVIKKKKHNK